MFSFKGLKFQYNDAQICIDNLCVKNNMSVIIGQNNSGKTAFLKLVAGLISPKQGTIEYSEGTLNSASKGLVQFDRYFLSVDPENFEHFTGLEDIEFTLAGRRQDYASLKSSIIDTSKKLAIYRYLNKSVKVYNSSTKRKLEYIKLLYSNASYYLIDEPLLFLDVYSSLFITEELIKLSKAGKKVIVAINSPYFLYLLFNYGVSPSILSIKEGRVHYYETSDISEQQRSSLLSLLEL